jgi:PST family polysaccharide transporter
MARREVEQIEVEDLRGAAVAGLRWTTAARIGIEVVSFGAAVALARLVPPAEFGAAVVPLILVPLAVILTFEGFGSALVQRRSIESRHVEAAMLAGTLSGALLTALVLILAEPLGRPLLGAPQADLLKLISPVFLLAGVSAVPRGLLWRRLDFRRTSLIEVGALTFGALTAVGLAVAGLDAEAIVLGALTGAFVNALLLLAAVPPPLPRWERGALVEVLGFGLPASAAGLASVAITNSTLAVAAVRLAPAQAGLFWRAFQLGVVYQEKISWIMIRLAFPVYSRTRDLDQLRGFHERATRIHAAVLVPLLALLIVVAPDLVPWIFGERWAAAANPVQILCVAGMIAAVLTGYPQIMLAAGRPRVLLGFNLALLSLYGVASWVAAPYGIGALAVAVVAVHVVLLVAVYLVLYRRVLGIPVRRLVTDLLPAATGSTVLLAAALPVTELLRAAQAPVPLLLLGAGVSGGIAYLLALSRLFPTLWDELTGLARRLLPAPRATLRPQRAGGT